MACSIAVKHEPRGSIVAVSGDADLNSTADLQAAIEEAAERPGARVIVDLSGATLIDSRMIGVLVTSTQSLRSRGTAMSIVCDNADILRLFATIGLERELQFYPTRDAASGD